jgi:hypothetical protein
MHVRSIRRHGRAPHTWLYRDLERPRSHAHEREGSKLAGAELAQNLSGGLLLINFYNHMKESIFF